MRNWTIAIPTLAWVMHAGGQRWMNHNVSQTDGLIVAPRSVCPDPARAGDRWVAARRRRRPGGEVRDVCTYRKRTADSHVSGRGPALLEVYPEAGGVDAGDVGLAITVEIGDCAGSCCHVAVNLRTDPLFAVVTVEIKMVGLASESRNDLVFAVAIEIAGLDGVAVEQ